MAGTFGYKDNDGLTTPLFGSDTGGDPESKARRESSNARRRVGSTPAQRANLDPEYRPGYGKGAPANTTGSLLPKAQWDEQFKPLSTPATNTLQTSPAPAVTSGQPMRMGEPGALTAPANLVPFDHYIPPMNNTFPGQAATASLAPHVQVQSNYRNAINPAASGNESAAQYANIQAGNAAAYAPGGMTGRIDPYQTATPTDLGAIAARYGAPGGANGVAFVHDQRSNVDANGNPAPVAKTLPKIPGVTPAVDANKSRIDPYA